MKEKKNEMSQFDLTPLQIVAELDKYIVGQDQAKRIVAIALRNRMRRRRLAEAMRQEVTPKNIILIGPTGVGKTEIARRLAALVKAPFVKVEASKYTEVGYVGRDVESMIRDLVSQALNLVREEKFSKVRAKAEEIVNERLVNLLVPVPGKRKPMDAEGEAARKHLHAEAREKVKRQLKANELEDEMVEFETKEQPTMPMVEIFSGANMDELGMNIQDMMQNLMPGGQPGQPRSRRIKVAQARRQMVQEELSKMVDMSEVKSEAVRRVEEMGIVFY